MANNLRKLRKWKDWTVAATAQAFGMSEDGYGKVERGSRGLRDVHIQKAARIYGVRPQVVVADDFEAAMAEPATLQPVDMVSLPIVGIVEAGAYRAVDDLSQLETSDLPQVSVTVDGRYSGMKTFALEVRGDSMNEVIPSGYYASVVDYSDYVERYGPPETGKLVVMERSDGGHTREWTIKEVVAYRDRIDLVPRSTNPKHKSFTVHIGENDVDSGEIRIVGVVYGAHLKL